MEIIKNLTISNLYKYLHFNKNNTQFKITVKILKYLTKYYLN